MKEKFNQLSPFYQTISLFIIGLVVSFVLSMLLNVIYGQLYPEMILMSVEQRIETFPIAFMITQFLPIQVGLLLTPGLIYWSFTRKEKIVKRTNFKWIIWAFLLFVCGFFLLPFLGEINVQITKWIGLYDGLIINKETSDRQLTTLIGEVGSSSFIFAVLLIGVITGIAEELVFRRFLFYHMFKSTHRLGLSLVSSSFVFALLHFNYIQIIPLFSFGIILALMYYVTRSIIPGIIAHALNNIINLYWLSTNSYPSWMKEIDLRYTIPATLLLLGLVLFFPLSSFSSSDEKNA